MPSQKTLGEDKPWLAPLSQDAVNLERAEEIQTALDSLPDLSSGGMASLATKMNHAVMMGQVTLTSAEANALKTLSSKYIPDAPKQINLQAEVKTENIIFGWLENNDSLRDVALHRAQESLNAITVLELEGALDND